MLLASGDSQFPECIALELNSIGRGYYTKDFGELFVREMVWDLGTPTKNTSV